MGAVWKAVAVLRLTWALLVIKVLFTARRMGRLRLAPKRLAYEEMYSGWSLLHTRHGLQQLSHDLLLVDTPRTNQLSSVPLGHHERRLCLSWRRRIWQTQIP